MSNEQIPGYDFGEKSVPEASVNIGEFEHLEQSVRFTEEDEQYLQMAGDILNGQTDDILDVWYGFVADNEFLLYYFTDGESNPDEEYLDRVRERFKQWIHDTCKMPYDEDWLNYQFEIARRHHRMKNQIDEANAVAHIDLQYLIAFVSPITAMIWEFLMNGDHTNEENDVMYHAWFKSIVLQVTLLSHPYMPEDN
jgi:hypothetical protein